MRKPREFVGFPISYMGARALGALRAYGRFAPDGDTFDAFVDVGLHEYPYKTIRLAQYNTAEMGSADLVRLRLAEAAHMMTQAAIVDSPLLLFIQMQLSGNAEKLTLCRYVAVTRFWQDGQWIDLGQELFNAGLTI